MHLAQDRVAFIAELRRWEQWRGEVSAAHGQRAGWSSVNDVGCERGGGMGAVQRCCGGVLASLA